MKILNQYVTIIWNGIEQKNQSIYLINWSIYSSGSSNCRKCASIQTFKEPKKCQTNRDKFNLWGYLKKNKGHLQLKFDCLFYTHKTGEKNHPLNPLITCWPLSWDLLIAALEKQQRNVFIQQCVISLMLIEKSTNSNVLEPVQWDSCKTNE